MLKKRKRDGKTVDFKCVSKRFYRASEKAMRLRHHVGLHSVLRDWNGWAYVNRLHVWPRFASCVFCKLLRTLCVVFFSLKRQKYYFVLPAFFSCWFWTSHFLWRVMVGNVVLCYFSPINSDSFTINSCSLCLFLSGPFTEPICCVRALINHTAISSVCAAFEGAWSTRVSLASSSKC